jgi:hypothetical protein
MKCVFSTHPHFFFISPHHVDARGGTQGGGYRRKDGNGEVDDFL